MNRLGVRRPAWRRTLRLAVAVSIISAGILGLSGDPAAACSCAETEVAEYANEVSVAFIGRQVDRTVLDEFADNGAVLTFQVDWVYKGDVSDTLQIRTHAQGSACGMDFGAEQVAVTASRWQGVLSVGLCRSFVTKAELVDVFGVGGPPLEVAPDQPQEEESTNGGAANEVSLDAADHSAGGSRIWPLSAAATVALLVLVTMAIGIAAIVVMRSGDSSEPPAF